MTPCIISHGGHVYLMDDPRVARHRTFSIEEVVDAIQAPPENSLIGAPIVKRCKKGSPSASSDPRSQAYQVARKAILSLKPLQNYPDNGV